LACDCSAVAVDVCKSVIEKENASATNCFGAFVSDPSFEVEEANTTFSQDVMTAYMQLLSGSLHTATATNNPDECLADIVLMVFVLSAVPPKRVSRFLQQIYNATKCGGKVCFRDYALYDLPMMRFKESHCVHTSSCCDFDGAKPRLYERGDGTLSRFFDLETIRHVFEGVGFVMEELRYATVYNDNRKTGERLKRAFVHAVFSKPL
jgi:methyltransferase-like protein 6